MTDTGFMREALALAEKGMGFVSPNPLVGAVIVRNGEIIGRGWHWTIVKKVDRRREKNQKSSSN